MSEITTLEQLKSYAGGQVVVLPPFAEGQPFVARLKRPSMLRIAQSGNIPNSLLVKANELFVDSGQSFDPDDKGLLKDMCDVLELLASYTFVEPTYQQLKEAGVELTDDQLMFVFNYVQGGVKALEPFRTEQ